MDFDFPTRIDTDFLAQLQMANFEADLDDPPKESVVLVAEEADTGTILGFIQLEPEKDWISKRRFGHIERVAVAHEAQGKGVAKELLQAADQWCKEQGFPMLTLEVFSANKHAIGFYEHLGFNNETQKMTRPID